MGAGLLKANQISQACFIILLLLHHVLTLWCICLKISYIFGSVHMLTLVYACVYQRSLYFYLDWVSWILIAVGHLPAGRVDYNILYCPIFGKYDLICCCIATLLIPLANITNGANIFT